MRIYKTVIGQRWRVRSISLSQYKGQRLVHPPSSSSSLPSTANHTFSQHLITPKFAIQSFHSSTHTLYDGKGQDLLEHSSSPTNDDGTPKIILDSYYPNTGIDVLGLLDSSNPIHTTLTTDHNSNNNHSNSNSNNDIQEHDNTPKSILMNSSILAFPHACYLWKPKTVKEITLESLSMVPLCKPSIEYLFIGSDTPMPPRELNRIKKGLSKYHIVVDQLDVMNAMGTFNILNGEDRRVAVAILIPVENGLEK